MESAEWADSKEERSIGQRDGDMKPVVFVLILSTCNPALAQQMQTGWAWAGIASVTLGKSSAPAPAPAPLPMPGDACKQCNGTGKVGDGKVSQTCRDCNGTGKVIGMPVSATQQKAADFFLVPHSPVGAGIVSQPVQIQDCPGGVCPFPVQSRSQIYVSPQQTTVRKGWIFKR